MMHETLNRENSNTNLTPCYLLEYMLQVGNRVQGYEPPSRRAKAGLLTIVRARTRVVQHNTVQYSTVA